MCVLLVWRVCGQAFGRYRPLKGAEKWSRDHHENWKFAYKTYKTRTKITDFKNTVLFDLRRTITNLSRKTVSEQWRHQELVNAWPSWIDARRQYILSSYNYYHHHHHHFCYLGTVISNTGNGDKRNTQTRIYKNARRPNHIWCGKKHQRQNAMIQCNDLSSSAAQRRHLGARKTNSSLEAARHRWLTRILLYVLEMVSNGMVWYGYMVYIEFNVPLDTV